MRQNQDLNVEIYWYCNLLLQFQLSLRLVPVTAGIVALLEVPLRTVSRRLLVPLNTDLPTVHACIKLVVAVCSKPGTLAPVSILLTQNAAVAQELQQSLVERLETDEPEDTGL